MPSLSQVLELRVRCFLGVSGASGGGAGGCAGGFDGSVGAFCARGASDTMDTSGTGNKRAPPAGVSVGALAFEAAPAFFSEAASTPC